MHLDAASAAYLITSLGTGLRYSLLAPPAVEPMSCPECFPVLEMVNEQFDLEMAFRETRCLAELRSRRTVGYVFSGTGLLAHSRLALTASADSPLDCQVEGMPSNGTGKFADRRDYAVIEPDSCVMMRIRPSVEEQAAKPAIPAAIRVRPSI